MTDTTNTLVPRNPVAVANKALQASATFWFIVAASGLWVFVFYVAAYYIAPGLLGGLPAWSELRLPDDANVYTAGDGGRNIAMAAHLFVAVIVMGGGILQLIPQIRTRFAAFHRWNGRIYIVTAISTSLAGLYMVWIKETNSENVVGHISISLDGVLIIIFAVLTMRYAIAGHINVHRRWALRLFMVVNAVWFLRIGVMLWFLIFAGPTPYFGIFFKVWGFGQYLLPLAVLELYFRAKRSAGTRGKFAMAGGLVFLTIVMGIGIVMATMGMWLPRIG